MSKDRNTIARKRVIQAWSFARTVPTFCNRRVSFTRNQQKTSFPYTITPYNSVLSTQVNRQTLGTYVLPFHFCTFFAFAFAFYVHRSYQLPHKLDFVEISSPIWLIICYHVRFIYRFEGYGFGFRRMYRSRLADGERQCETKEHLWIFHERVFERSPRAEVQNVDCVNYRIDSRIYVS